MLRIAIMVCLLCTLMTAFAQAGDIYPDLKQLTGPDIKGYDTVVGQHWYSLEIGSSYGGSVTPAGLIRVREGDTVTLTIRPNRGFHIQKVIIDGRSVSPQPVYKFANIRRNHTAYVEFAPNQRS